LTLTRAASSAEALLAGDDGERDDGRAFDARDLPGPMIVSWNDAGIHFIYRRGTGR
jgi:hypothetical protein